MAFRKTGRISVAFTAALTASLALGACSSSSSGGSGGTNTAINTPECADYKIYGDHTGKSVSIYTSIIAPEDAQHKQSYALYEKCTGTKINYEGSKEFEAQLVVRVKSGNPPDIAFLPQPGLLQTLVNDTGKVLEAPADTAANVDKWFGKDWKGYGSVNGTFYAAPLGANVKSFVWYSPTMFKKNNWAIPTTWDDMLKLSDTIAATGIKPWCAGFGSGDATGWPGTDWVEDVMLRTAGPDVYDQWIAHKIPFNDPKVIAAFDKVGQILKNDKYVNGGLGDVKSIATTTFQDGGIPITTGKCAMHRQASFYASNWPKGTKIAVDGDVFAFYLPPIDPAFGKPVEGGGEFVAAFANRPEVTAFQTYLSSDTWANGKAKLGNWVSANKGVLLANYNDPINALSAKILQDTSATFRFDASDLMPSAVGAGSFWKGMTAWITGQSTTDTVNAIEASWPKS